VSSVLVESRGLPERDRLLETASLEGPLIGGSQAGYIQATKVVSKA
jgi:hypothetical protein